MPTCLHRSLLRGGLRSAGPGHGTGHQVQRDHTSPCGTADCLTACVFLKASITPRMALRSEAWGDPPLPPPPPSPTSAPPPSTQRPESIFPPGLPLSQAQSSAVNFIPLSKQYGVSAWNPPQFVSGRTVLRLFRFFWLNWCSHRINLNNPDWRARSGFIRHKATMPPCWCRIYGIYSTQIEVISPKSPAKHLL